MGQNIEYTCKLFGGYVDMYRVHFLPTPGEPEHSYLENWDILRRAKEAGNGRAIGTSCHTEQQKIYALLLLKASNMPCSLTTSSTPRPITANSRRRRSSAASD